MKCPHCETEHEESTGRFCAHCGLSVIAYAVPHGERKNDSAELEADERADEEKIACPHCGVRATSPVCPACGARMPAPEE